MLENVRLCLLVPKQEAALAAWLMLTWSARPWTRKRRDDRRICGEVSEGAVERAKSAMEIKGLEGGEERNREEKRERG